MKIKTTKKYIRLSKITAQDFLEMYAQKEPQKEVIEDVKKMMHELDGRNDHIHGDEMFLDEIEIEENSSDEDLDALADEWQNILKGGKRK